MVQASTMDDGRSWNEQEWRTWLAGQIETKRKVFLTSAAEMISAYYQERDAARDYHGRELLELLQNADDAGAEIETKNRVLIELGDDGFLIANTGKPFTTGSVMSLMIPNYSPKKLSRTRLIGYKGLGFRSVLGWASEIGITSHGLQIGFSENAASEVGNSLCEMSPAISNSVKEILNRTGCFPIPTLAFPVWLKDLPAASDKFERGLQRSAALIEEGFDTVVAFTFRDEAKTRLAVESQISSLGKEVLLFSNFLEKAETKSSKRNVVWDADRQAGEILIVASDEKEPSQWQIFTDDGQVPPEYIDPGQAKETSYEIKIAAIENPSWSNASENRLFVYFPTAVVFPFPVVAHATFELTSNRQHLVESNLNDFVADRLADLMAVAAEKSANDPRKPWNAFSIVTPQAPIDPVLRKLGSERQGFLHALTGKCMDERLIPVRDDQFWAANDHVRRIKGNFDEVLSGKEFEDVSLHTENMAIIERLDAMGIELLTAAQIRERIDRVSGSLPLEKRASIIFGLIDNELVEDGEGPALLLDQDNRLIPAGVTTFLPPEGTAFNIPAWVPLRFINSTLAMLIGHEFGISRVRDLARLLEGFSVQEYNLASIISAILAESNKQVESEDELQVRQRTVAAIFTIFIAINPEESTHLDKVVILPTRTGKFLGANQLYFGGEYSCGKLMEALLGKACPDCFVAGPQAMGLRGQSERIEPFLRWLGVEDLPRETKLSTSPSTEFREAVLTAIKYPAHFGGGEFTMNSPDEVRYNSCSLSQVSSFDHIEEMLKSSDPHAILAWLAVDRRQSLIRNNDQGSLLCILPHRYRDRRILSHQAILAYPMWLLRNAEWLPTTGGLKAPSKCSVAHGLSKELWSIIGVPIIDEKQSIFSALGIDRNSINSSLAILGVSNDLNDLSWGTFYEILLRLPETDPEGTTARSLYRAFVTREEPPVYCPMRERFFKTGKMFGRHGTESGYLPVEHLYYLDNVTLPEHIARFFPLLELDKRRGAAKVRTLFNVTSLAADEIQTRIKVTDYEVHPWARPLQDDFERLKPYIYALRVEFDSDRSEPPTLKRLEIKLCRSVKATIEVNAGSESLDLRPGDSIVVGHIAYLVGEPRDYQSSYLSDVIVADAVGEIVASLLKVEGLKSDIARLATCPPEQRDNLLDRMSGGTGASSLATAAQALDSPIEPEVQRPVVTQVPIPAAAAPPTSDLPTPPVGNSEPDILPPKEVGPVAVAAIDIPTTTGGVERKRGLVISPNPRPPRRRRLVDPDRSENLAFQFEIEQGRFPKKVGHLRGIEGFGCDLLSFETKDVRLAFETDGDTSTVLRSIEVKGKVSDRGSVTLKGNELAAAKKYGNRYYLYRVYEDDDNQGVFELVELADPIGAGEAVKIVYEVNPFHSSTKLCWDVRERVVEDEERHTKNG